MAAAASAAQRIENEIRELFADFITLKSFKVLADQRRSIASVDSNRGA
jgi:hypothetical protein